MAFKVKINELPSLEKEPQITTSIKENPYKANVEIEKDELVVRPDLAAIYKAKGEKHSKGGIKTYLPDNSFVISDDKSLAFTKDEHDLLELKKGGSSSPSKNTPADVLKRNLDVKHYNKMTSILGNSKKDEFSKRTAAMMLSKYEDVLGRVAYGQEAKKGFPTGLAEFSKDVAPVYNNIIKEKIEQQPQYMKKGGTTNEGEERMRSSTPKERDSWNRFVKYLNENKIAGSKDLDMRDKSLGMSYLEKFNQTNPDYKISPEFIKIAQQEAALLKQGIFPEVNSDLEFPLNQYKSRQLSPIDGWLGSITSSQISYPMIQKSMGDGTKKDFGYDYAAYRAFIQGEPKAMAKLRMGGNPYLMADGGFTNYYDKTAKKQYKAPTSLKPEDFYRPEVLQYMKELDKMKGYDNDLGVYQDNTWGQRHQQAYEHFGDNYFSQKPMKKLTGETISTPRNVAINMPTIKSNAMPNKIDGEVLPKRGMKDWEFSNWQKADMAMSALDAASVRQQFPYRSQIKSPLVELEKSNTQRTMNIIDNSVYNAALANKGINPYLVAGNNASLFGKGLDAKANIQSDNVAIGNQQNMMNNQIQRGDAAANIAADQQYYKESVQGRTNFDNMQQFARNRFREQLNRNVEANQVLSYNMMTQNNPAYGYDWKTGKFYLTGKNPLDVQTSGTDYMSQMQSVILNKLQSGTLTPAEAALFRNMNRRNAKMGGKINPYKK